jgi:SPP1 family predicted phage head-tail adaptor
MIKTINLSDMRHRLELEQPQRTSLSGGGVSVTWVKLADIWASITPLKMREHFTRHQVNSEITHSITIRYRADVRPEMRLVKGTRVFEIISVLNEQERNRWLQLECSEQVPESAI